MIKIAIKRLYRLLISFSYISPSELIKKYDKNSPVYKATVAMVKNAAKK